MPTSETSPTAGEISDDAAGVTGSEVPHVEEVAATEEPDLTEGSVADVKDRVGGEMNLIRTALEQEQGKDEPRKGLVKWLEGQIEKSGKVIVFDGSELVIRRLSAVDFERANVEAPEEVPVEWSKFPGGNNHTVDVSGWSDEQVNAVLAMDSRFKVREG